MKRLGLVAPLFMGLLLAAAAPDQTVPEALPASAAEQEPTVEPQQEPRATPQQEPPEAAQPSSPSTGEETEEDEGTTISVEARFSSGSDRAEKILTRAEAEGRLEPGEAAALHAALAGADSEPPAVAMVVPVAFFATVVGIVALVLVGRARREGVRHETIRLAIERGAEIPTELLLPPTGRRSDVRNGLVLVLGGLGLSIMLAVLAEDDPAWAVGVFPMMVGVGYLAYAWLERRGLG